MSYFIGLDGGGSKTKSVLVDENMNVISSYVGKSINFNSIGLEETRNNLKEISDALLKDENIAPECVCIGCAALNDRADSDLTVKLCNGLFNCSNVILDSDLYIALEAGDTDGPFAVAVCGTGSMAVGRLQDGTIIHRGGFGYLLGDEGSGYSIAKDGICAVLRAHEKSGPYTEISSYAIDDFGVLNPYDLIDEIYSPSMTVSKLAAFAPDVLQCASEGDEIAMEIVKRNAEGFADTVCSLLKRMPSGTPLGLWGGIMQNWPEFRKIFSDKVKENYPDTEISILKNAPEKGAALAAIKAVKK